MPLFCATIKRSQAIQLMTAKLKLRCLNTDRPTPSDKTLLTFLKLKDTGRLVGTGVDKANSPWAQVPAQDGVTRFYLEAYTVSAFLSKNDLVELPDEKLNHEREAYQKATNAWYSSDLGDKASCHSYDDTKQLFISNELLKAGYTISDELYVTYCLC
jgi:hypothetical protein